MSTPRLIGPPPSSTPVEGRRSPRRRRSLPDDLLKIRDASRRLGVISLIAAALWAVGTVLYDLVMYPADPRWIAWQPIDAIAVVSVLISLALFAYTRSSERDARFIIDLGLVYMVLMSAGAGQILHSDPLPSSTPVLAAIPRLVLMFAAVLPSTPMNMPNRVASAGWSGEAHTPDQLVESRLSA
jgi:hypothetical protein